MKKIDVLVLIDESGDAAFKITQGSTAVFVIAMVVFRDFKDAEKASFAIRELRKQRHLKSEFRFSKCPDQFKDAFFECVTPFNFEVCALVVEKAKLYSEHLRQDKDHFYNFFLRKLLGNGRLVLEGATIKLDGKGNRNYKRELQAYLRDQLVGGTIASFRFIDSKRDDLIQLADMVTGAIARSYRQDRKDAPRWRDKLAQAGRIHNVWEFQ